MVKLDDVATQTGFALLVGVSQQAISTHCSKGTLPAGGTYAEWLKLYCQHQRDEAAGRGGSKQESLAVAKTDESRIKAALGRLSYQEKVGTLVPAVDAERTLVDWAGFANREITNGIDKLISEIENAYSIEIDDELVTGIVGSTTRRIAGHADKLGRSLVEGEVGTPAS